MALGSRRSVLASGALLAGVIATGPRLRAAEALPKIRVGGTPNYGPVLPIMAAEKLGLFSQAKVTVEFTGYQGGAASMEALAAGEADIINYLIPGLAMAKSRGVKATMISAGTYVPRGWRIMVAKNSPITDLKQLVGKKVGTSAAGSSTDFFALWAQTQAGGAFTRVPVGGSGLIPNLTAGNVDAVVAFPPVSYQIEITGIGRTLVDLGTAMPPNLPDIWIASDQAIATNAEGVRRFLAAFYGAVRYMKANRDWTIKFIQDTTKFAPEVARLEFENTVQGLVDDGTFKPEYVETSLELAKLSGLKELPAPASLTTTEFLPVKPLSP